MYHLFLSAGGNKQMMVLTLLQTIYTAVTMVFFQNI